MTSPSYQGLRVLILESRRSRELAALVTTYGGRPFSAPALREVPLDSNPQALAFADALICGEIDVVALLTGVGTRALLDVVEHAGRREAFVAALGRAKVAVRGPKPLAVLRELKIQPWVAAAPPNTWRELLIAIDAAVAAAGDGATLAGRAVAVQEYGASNPELLRGFEARGACVTAVPVYRWALPEDLTPLQDAVRAAAAGELDVALFTTGTQAVHLMQVATALGLESQLRHGLSRMVIASIGPTTSEELRQQGQTIDLEASQSKMGILARDAAAQSPSLLERKRTSSL
ncbi:MAG: uroporphyrinogen-III synthase [Acidobacteria bacterium]|nr:uroporphyrinogen-III synthase [Acidobacteriota bacterium]